MWWLFSVRACAVALALVGCSALAMAREAAPGPAGSTVVREVQAGGAQVYACRRLPTGIFAWMLVGPKAVLVNDDGSDFGTHAAGPTWMAVDGSKITADGAHPLEKITRPNAVPGLLLTVTSAEGNGMLTGVRYVRRAETEGGLAPDGGCDAAREGATVASHYSAVYTFYR